MYPLKRAKYKAPENTTELEGEVAMIFFFLKNFSTFVNTALKYTEISFHLLSLWVFFAKFAIQPPTLSILS